MSVFISKNRTHEVYGKHLVFIFDECHRSQFGDMHTAIIKKFKRYHLFGFTGTPIFPVNAGAGGKFDLKTTEQAFGKQLHIYTIVDAIADGNVLPFRVDYVSTMREQENIKDEQVRNIDASVRWQLLPVSVVLQTTYWNISTKRLSAMPVPLRSINW